MQGQPDCLPSLRCWGPCQLPPRPLLHPTKNDFLLGAMAPRTGHFSLVHHILLLLIITFRQMCGLNLGGKAWVGPLLKVEHCSCEFHLVQNNNFFKGPCLGIRNYYYQRFAKYTSLFSKNFIRKPIQPVLRHC